jgi:hypothetical protein
MKHLVKMLIAFCLFGLCNLVSGTYFLKVSDNNKEVKTFKIIKN